jgi:hypothetical protein
MNLWKFTVKPVLLAFGNKYDIFTKSFRKVDSGYNKYLPQPSGRIPGSQTSFMEMLTVPLLQG